MSHFSGSVCVRNLKVIEVKDRTMKEDPEKKYRMDKTLMMETYDRGEIQLMEKTCILDLGPSYHILCSYNLLYDVICHIYLHSQVCCGLFG